MDPNAVEPSVSVSNNETATVLRLRGSFQLELARPLYEAALQVAASGGNAVVDCRAAVHLDACAVQVLLALKIALERAGGRLRLSGASDEVCKYLQWAGVAAHLVRGEARGAPGAASPPKRRKTARNRQV